MIDLKAHGDIAHVGYNIAVIKYGSLQFLQSNCQMLQNILTFMNEVCHSLVIIDSAASEKAHQRLQTPHHQLSVQATGSSVYVHKHVSDFSNITYKGRSLTKCRSVLVKVL